VFLVVLEFSPSSMASLRKLLGHAEDIDMKRGRDESVEVKPLASDMQFCVLIKDQDTAVDVHGTRRLDIPTRKEFIPLLAAFKAGCFADFGMDIAHEVEHGTDTAALVYDMTSANGGREILAIATFDSTMTSPSKWIDRVRYRYNLYWRAVGGLGNRLLQGDASQWKPAVDRIAKDNLHFYIDYACSANSVARVNGKEVRRGGGSFLVAKVGEYINNLFIQPAIKMATFEQWVGQPVYRFDTPPQLDKGGEYERRINAMSILKLQSLAVAEGFWRDNMKFVKYTDRGMESHLPLYMRYVNLPMQPKITKFAFDPPPPAPRPDKLNDAEEPSVIAGSQKIKKVPQVTRVVSKVPNKEIVQFYKDVDKIAAVFVAIFFKWYPEARPRENMTPVTLIAWMQEHTTPILQGSGDIRIDVLPRRILPKKTMDVMMLVCKFMWLVPRNPNGYYNWSTPEKPSPAAYKALLFEIRSAVRQNTSSGRGFMNRTPEGWAQLRLNDPTRGMNTWSGKKGLLDLVEAVVSSV